MVFLLVFPLFCWIWMIHVILALEKRGFTKSPDTVGSEVGPTEEALPRRTGAVRWCRARDGMDQTSSKGRGLSSQVWLPEGA